MAREQINDMLAGAVAGGSIVFNGDHTTCGHNCNDQYKVVDYDKVNGYIAANCTKMTERKMLANLVDQGLLIEL